MKATVDYFGKVRRTGYLAIIGNAFAVFAIYSFQYQSGGHGEIGRSYHDTMIWTFLFSGWGLATGIGLLRAWRWARVSTLIFSGLLIPIGILGIVGFLLMPAGDVSGWTLIILRTSSTFVFLIPIAVGLRWLFFFTRKEVKACFQTGL